LCFALRSRKVECALVRTGSQVEELEAALGWILNRDR
jgi:hypothetical protein